jgi:hypothetical protein
MSEVLSLELFCSRRASVERSSRTNFPVQVNAITCRVALIRTFAGDDRPKLC